MELGTDEDAHTTSRGKIFHDVQPDTEDYGAEPSS
jgi:hypothetical protein